MSNKTPDIAALVDAAMEAEQSSIENMRQAGRILNEVFELCPRGEYEKTLRKHGWAKSMQWAYFLRRVHTHWDRMLGSGFDPGSRTIEETREQLKLLNADDATFMDKIGSNATTPANGQAKSTKADSVRVKRGSGDQHGAANPVGAAPVPAKASAASPAPTPTARRSEMIDVAGWRKANAAYTLNRRIVDKLIYLEGQFNALFNEVESAEVKTRIEHVVEGRIVVIIQDVVTAMKLYGPAYPCPMPHTGTSCPQCKNRGYINEEQYKGLPPAIMRKLK